MPLWPLDPSLDSAPRAPAVFVGRATELAHFERATDELRLVLVLGLGGMGKTSFMLRAAEGLAQRRRARRVYHVCRPGESVATMAAAILDQLGVADRTVGPLEALLRAAETQPLVICLDDAQRVGESALFEGLVYLATRRRPLWICVASREALPISPVVVDHLVLRLAGLLPDETGVLWAALEQLYGPPAVPLDGETATGSPFLLKQAFAGPAHAPGDPLGLDGLGEPERELLVQLCAFRRPMAASMLGTTTAALVDLQRRFLVDSDARQTLAVHDLVREAVQASAQPVGRRHHLRCLRYYQPVPDDETVELELLHHAVEAAVLGDPSETGAELDLAYHVLRRHATHLRRLMPASAVVERELAFDIDRLATLGPSPPWLRLLRLRLASRQGQAAAVCDEIASIAADGEPLAALDHGEIAFMLGRLDDAESSLLRAAADDTLGEIAQLWALGILTEVHRARGEWDRLDAALAGAADLLHRTGFLGTLVRSWSQGLVADECQQYTEAAAALAAVRRAVGSVSGLGAKTEMMRPYERAVSAAAGKPLGAIDSDEMFDETLFMRLVARLLRVCELRFFGQLAEAATLARATRTAAEACHLRPIALWALWLAAEAESVLGTHTDTDTVAELESAGQAATESGHHRMAARIRAACVRTTFALGHHELALDGALALGPKLTRMPGVAARMRALGALVHASAGRAEQAVAAIGTEESAQGYDLAEWRLLRLEVLLWLGTDVPEVVESALRLCDAATAAGWRWIACRASLLGAEAALRRADLDVTIDEEACSAYPCELAFAGLLVAAEHLLRGDRQAAQQQLERLVTRTTPTRERQTAEAALAFLNGTNIPDHHGSRLARRLQLIAPRPHQLTLAAGTFHLTDEQLAHLDAGTFVLVVDAGQRSVRLGARTVDFARNGTLFDLVHALARPPGTLVATDVLVQRVWGIDHHPLRHHSRVTMAVTRLRRLIGAELLEGTPAGYRLVAAGTWALIEPRPT